MKMISCALGVAAAAAILAGCSSGGSPSALGPSGVQQGAAGVGHPMVPQSSKPVSLIPEALRPKGPMPLYGRAAPATGIRGLYVSEFYLTTNNVLGYKAWNVHNHAPICHESTGTNVNDIAVDTKGNLIVPNAFSGVNVYQGPGMCGALLGTATDAYGQASDAAAIDATTLMVVGNIGGSVVICAGPTSTCGQLTSPNMSTLAGVAMDKSGNCYADAFNTSGTVSLWYYAGCSTMVAGVQVSGFSEPYYGGLDIDKDGNLVVISLLNASFSTPSTVTVYTAGSCASGTCTILGGPFSLQGESVFGHLNKGENLDAGAKFAVGDITHSQIDIYKYTPTSLTYLYSFNNGLTCATDLCEGVAFNPHNKQ